MRSSSRPGTALILFFAILMSWVGGSLVAEAADAAEEAEQPESDSVGEAATDAHFRLGFFSPRSVGGTLRETSERQRGGVLETFRAQRETMEESTGLSFGFDNNTQYLATNSDQSPSDAAGNVFRVYGSWSLVGQGTSGEGALVFKIEDRSAIGNKLSPQALGPSLGYAGLFSSTFSDAGGVLTNLYWRQRFARGRGAFVIGQVDPSDYVNVNSAANPWTAFTNLAFEQQPAFALPSQGLGAAMQWRLNDSWQLLGGLADANADPSEPYDSAKNLFDVNEWFKHFAVAWSQDWDDRYDQSVQLTFWHADERVEAGIDGGHGVALLASARVENWSPFLRAAYAEDAGVLNDRSISIGTGYDARGGTDLAGLALNWARAPEVSRDQYTLEAFYRYELTDFLLLTPEVQYVVNAALDPDAGNILVWGLRVQILL